MLVIPVPTPPVPVTPVPTPPVSVTPVPTPPVSVTPVPTPPVSVTPVPTPPVSVTPVPTPPVPVTPAPAPPVPVTPVPTPPVPVTPAPSTVTLTGRATYDSIPNLNGPLVYAGVSARPVRAASVEVLDANGAAVATATTDDNGIYAVTVPANAMLTVRVQALLLRSGAAATWDVSVRDNTKENALYTMESTAFSSGTAAVKQDLHAPSGWDGTGYKSLRVAAPFAVMDTVYTAMQKVQSVAPETRFPALKVFWSPNNLPSVGNRVVGQIVSSHFTSAPGGAEIYVLGKEDVDTDEFDAPVIAHEWGHYYETMLSRKDSAGGMHGEPDRLDRRVAFSEGWGNGWSGIALERRNYVDSYGPRQARGGDMNLSQGLADNPGWYREVSIQSIFWNLNAQVGFKPIHDALTSASFKSGAALTSIHSFAAALNTVSPGSMFALAGLLRGQRISDAANDPFGLLERNDSGAPAVPNVLPMHTEAQVGVPVAACVSNVAGGPNKVGNFSYFHFTAPASRDYVWQLMPSTEGSNLDISFYRAGVISRFRRGDSALRVALDANADYIAAVHDLNGTSACFNLTIQQGQQP